MIFNSDKEANDFKQNVLQKLRTDNVTVRFTKVDGSERTMQCTLAEKHIPNEKLPTTKLEESSSTVGSAVRVFDTEKQQWRSFRWDSVIEVK